MRSPKFFFIYLDRTRVIVARVPSDLNESGCATWHFIYFVKTFGDYRVSESFFDRPQQPVKK